MESINQSNQSNQLNQIKVSSLNSCLNSKMGCN